MKEYERHPYCPSHLPLWIWIAAIALAVFIRSREIVALNDRLEAVEAQVFVTPAEEVK